MALGRHINERGHVVTKQRDRRTGRIEEHEDLDNLDLGLSLGPWTRVWGGSGELFLSQ